MRNFEMHERDLLIKDFDGGVDVGLPVDGGDPCLRLVAAVDVPAARKLSSVSYRGQIHRRAQRQFASLLSAPPPRKSEFPFCPPIAYTAGRRYLAFGDSDEGDGPAAAPIFSLQARRASQ